MEQYLEFAKKLTEEAGEIALKYFSFEVENIWKEDSTPLTKADTEINDLVINFELRNSSFPPFPYKIEQAPYQGPEL